MTRKLIRLVADGSRHLVSPPTVTRTQAIDRMERAGALTHLISSLEHLTNGKERREGGVNNWEITKDTVLPQSRLARRMLDVFARPACTNGIHVARVAAAISLMAPGSPRQARIAANALLAGSSYALHPRHHYGTDGSDQVSFLASSAALIARAAGERTRISDHVLWTVALQSTLSYAISGWAKLAGASWREGRALGGVMRTMTYGHEHAWKLTQRFPRTAKALGASVLALESSFPLAYLAGGRLANAYAAGTAAFHVGVAQIMGLGRFVPSFLSMHGAVQYTTRRSEETIPEGRRDDSLPRTVALSALGIAGLALVMRDRNRRRTLAGRGDERTLETRDGNTLTYRVAGPGGDTHPVFVLENALLGTTEHWEWYVKELSAHGTVVTYNRAGYAGSSAKRGTGLIIDDLVDDLVELVDHVAEGRPVVLVGHSLGGYLALRAGARLNAAPLAICLVDSSHPEEMQRSKRQEMGATALEAGLSLAAATQELGGGLLLEIPEWVRSMPAEAQRTMLAQFRDARLWRAGKREWTATRREFAGRSKLMPTDVPVLCISAQRTIDEDEAHLTMHRELAALSEHGSHQTIAHADHDSVMTNGAHARTAARKIVEFVASTHQRHSAAEITERVA